MRSSTPRHDRDSVVSRLLTLTAAVMTATTLHLSFAVLLIKAGTAGERLQARQAVEAPRLVADAGAARPLTMPAGRAG